MSTKKRTYTVAIVDDEPAQRYLLQNALERAGYATLLCENGERALEEAHKAHVMLLDVRMPGLSGLEVLEELRQQLPQLPVILLTAYIDVRDAVAAIKQGAVDYLEKPVDLDELIVAIDDTLGVVEKNQSGDDFTLPPTMLAESEAMRQIFYQAYRVAPSDATVLILGESGVGKEVVAEYLHKQSKRSEGPLIAVDCTNLPENLVESELFGHEKGAFTGAEQAHAGHFEAADGGTLFLDELGELPQHLQPKLLRVLETGIIRRIGGREDHHIDVRVIAATNRDLEAEVQAGRFREDLYYRLNVFSIAIPPLRERRDDILPLSDFFLDKQRKRISPAAQRLLMHYDWPGNVRELRNALERAAILTDGELILPASLPATLQRVTPQEESGSVLVGDMQEIQRRAILEALEKTEGNKTQAAALLGISRRNLIYKLRTYGL